MTDGPVVYTRKVARSGESFLVRIPRDVAKLLRVDGDTVVEVTLRVVGRESQS